jgi:uncharacterized protein (TIGR02453 family)
MTTAFAGWPPTAIDFYRELEQNNTRAWWQDNKATYESTVKGPMTALGNAIAREFGPMHIFRPNRDVRFSKDKSPYKTACAGVTEGAGGTGYYIQMSSTGLLVAAGYYAMAADQLERFREAIDDGRRGPALASVVADLQRARYEFGAHDELKTAPRGYPKDHPRIGLLRRKGLIMSKTYAPAKWMSTRAAFDRITGVWRDAAPLARWLDKHVGPSTLPPPEPR